MSKTNGEWWLVAPANASTTFICYMLNGICYPPPMFGEPIDANHLILINTIDINKVASGGFGTI